MKDETIALISLASYIGGLVFFGLSYNITMIFLSACVGFGSRMADSLLRSLVSHQVNDDEIGKVFGVVAVQGDLSLIIGLFAFLDATICLVSNIIFRVSNLQFHIHTAPENHRPARSCLPGGWLYPAPAPAAHSRPPSGQATSTEQGLQPGKWRIPE